MEERFPDNDHNSLLPGSRGSWWVKDVYGVMSRVDFRVCGEMQGGGFGSRVFKLQYLPQDPDQRKEYVALKILKAPSFLKFFVAFFARLFATFDFAWCQAEVRLAVLTRDLLARASKKRFGQERIVGSWRKSYTWIDGSFALLLKWHDSRRAHHGLPSGVGDQEVKARANFGRRLVAFLREIGALSYAWQFNHTRFEPLGNWYIWMTVIGAIAVLSASLLWDLPYDPKVNTMVWLVLCFTFAGASWMSADNLRYNRKTKEFDGLDLEFGMPHLGFALPTLVIVWGLLYFLERFWGMSRDWVYFLALATSTGYLFCFELPRVLDNIWAGYPISLGHLDIDLFEDDFADDREMEKDIGLYQELWMQYEAGRLNLFNRLLIDLSALFGWNLYARLPFSFQELRQRMIERWELKKKIAPEFALRMQNYPGCYWVFSMISLCGIIPWRFIFRSQYRRQRILAWRLRRLERMFQHKQISSHFARSLASGRQEIGWLSILLSFILWRKLHRVIFERHYRRVLFWHALRFCRSKEYVARWAIARFHKYLRKQRGEGRISKEVYETILLMEDERQIHQWLVLYFALMAPKTVTWPVRILAVLGVMTAQKLVEILPSMPAWWIEFIERDLVPYLPGWLAGILLGMALTALYEIICTWILGLAFRLRIIPYSKIERSRAGKVIVGFANITLYIIFGVVNGVPGFSIIGTPLVVSFYPQRLSFWLLVLVRWQSVALAAIRWVSFGMWGKGGLGEYYFQKPLVAAPALFFWQGVRTLGLA